MIVMDYKTFLFLSFFIHSLAHCQHLPKTCRSIPGDPSWPSPREWASLNKTLDGRLLQPPPPAAVCHPEQPSYDPRKCSNVVEQWKKYEYHVENPISVMSSPFANDACLPDPSLPCSSKGYPVFVVNATSSQHVKLGIDFARKHNIRLIVKNTGHDFIGRSTAPNSLSIWTHHINTIKSHKDGFRPKGCAARVPGTAVMLGAGVQMHDAFTHLHTLNQTMIGASGRTVGIGGYITGGGFSLLSPRYGLAADNVQEMEIVTPTGEIVTANKCQHKDLYWAVRGGGGSAFGVIISLTVRTFPSPRILAMDFMMVADATKPFIYDMAAFIFSQLPSLGEQGMSGFASAITGLPNPIPAPDSPKEVAGVIGRVILQDTSDEEDMMKLWQPINATIDSKWPGEFLFLPRIMAYDSYLEWIQVYYDDRPTGDDFYMASRLLDRKALTGNPSALANAIKGAACGTDALTAFLVSGKGVQKNIDNAVNPGWRRSFVHAVAGASFSPANATARAEAINKLDKIIQPFRTLSPKNGAYINEAFPYESDWQRTFWGDNYERLLDIKRKVDPSSVFWCRNCVGSEDWIEDAERLCKSRG